MGTLLYPEYNSNKNKILRGGVGIKTIEITSLKASSLFLMAT